MNRRSFMAAGLAGLTATEALTASDNTTASSSRQFFELRQYYLGTGANKGRVGKFLQEAGIPAMNRIGINPVGVFEAMYGPNQPTLYVLMVHPSLESVLNASARLLEDDELRTKGAGFIDASLSDPGYVRYESSLLAAFSHMPQIVPPAFERRIFELRIYESHSLKAAKKKIEMFNQGGEIAIFKKTGLNPVFFGETLIGRRQPNLTYMLAFEDLADRDQRWQVFREHPDWQKLRRDPAYRDTVSNITDIILRPTSYSQV
ncbi:MAG: NIPSNAP family protein [Phycisphaerales bacterium]|nr:MAG: NIPSNAP family protein [Phycisphaerales bacterium]